MIVHLWIVLYVADGLVSPGVSGLVLKGNYNDRANEPGDSSPSHLEEKSWMIDNAAGATSKTFTSTETIVNNDTSPETISTYNIIQVDKNKTEKSTFASDNGITVTTELPPTEDTTSATNSESPEGNKTGTDIELSTVATSEATEEPDECKPDNCTSANSCTFTKPSGCIRLQEDATEESFLYTIMAPHESSLISVEMEPGKGNLLPDSNIAFRFEECETTVENWIEKGKEIRRRIYISRGSSLALNISATNKSWINSTLRYQELTFEAKESRVEDTVDEGELGPPMLAGIRYRPMTEITYLMTASETRWNESSVMMTVSYIDLDEEDYLLIGAGNTSSGPKPFYFTGRITKSRNYFIASGDVYVHFVSRASQKVDKKGFHIKWKRSGTAIATPDDEPKKDTTPDYIIQSVGMCFYNKSLIAEFNRDEESEGPLQTFREKLASIANMYAKEKFIALDSVLKTSSVKIFRVSSVIEPIEDVMPEGGLYVMVSIVQQFNRETAVFRRRQLEEIIDQLDKENEKSDYSMLGFKAGHCPSVNTYLEWYIAAVLLVLISTIVLIFVWIYTSISKWRAFADSKKSSGEMEIVYCKEPEIPARENDYIRYTPGSNKPQVKITTCDGDTMTLESEILDESKLEQDDGPDRVIFDQEWIMKKRPSSQEVTRSTTAVAEIETRTPFLQTFAAPIPSSRNKDSGRMWTEMTSLPLQMNTQPVDHEYDCLIFPSRSTSTSTTCLVSDKIETKL